MLNFKRKTVLKDKIPSGFIYPIPDFQFVFRQNHLTIDQVRRITDIIASCYGGKTNLFGDFLSKILP